MPLESGKSEAVIGHNVKELEASGHPHKQAVAAALHNALDAHAAGILLTHGERALFLKRSDKSVHPGEWCCPGGSVEQGETPEQAARRELAEETGLTGLLTGNLNQIDEGDGFVTFRQMVDDEATPTLNEEHTEARWAPLSDPPQPLHPGVAATLKKLLATAIEAGKRESEAEKASVAAGEQEADAQRQAAALLSAHDKREYDTNGWFTIENNPLSGVGVYQYSEASIIKGGDPRKMVGVYRPAEELGSPECVDSFRLMPWTDDHPSDLLGSPSKGLMPAEDKGIEGVIGEQVYFKDGTLFGNIKVFSEALARKIASGKRELSVGYHCRFVPQEGLYEGKPYQYVQRDLRGNHLASVKAGKMGHKATVLDAVESLLLTFALDLQETVMPEKRKDEIEDCLDADTTKFIGDAVDAAVNASSKAATDSFNSLVGELEKKGYSKEYATKVAGKVAAEKGMTGHDSITKSGDTKVADSTKGDVKDPAGKGEDPKKDGDLKVEGKDGKSARDSLRQARDSRRSKDSMTAEEEEAEDAAEMAEDAEEEKEDEKEYTKEAKDRMRARDRRASARDSRKGARDKKAMDAKAALDASNKGKGMDAAAVTELVNKAIAGVKMPSTAEIVAQVRPAIRKEEAAKATLYGRISPLVGAFDHAEMTHVEMAAYGLKKLGVPEAKDDPVTALDYYLAGRIQSVTPATRTSARDGAATGTSLDARFRAFRARA